MATVCDLNPDIVGITESWTTNNVLDSELHLSGYRLFRCDRNTENRGGGVLLYVRDSFKATEVHMKSRYGEHVRCQIGELTLGVIYRSNNSQIVGQDTTTTTTTTTV